MIYFAAVVSLKVKSKCIAKIENYIYLKNKIMFIK